MFTLRASVRKQKGYAHGWECHRTTSVGVCVRILFEEFTHTADRPYGDLNITLIPALFKSFRIHIMDFSLLIWHTFIIEITVIWPMVQFNAPPRDAAPVAEMLRLADGGWKSLFRICWQDWWIRHSEVKKMNSCFQFVFPYTQIYYCFSWGQCSAYSDDCAIICINWHITVVDLR